mgnify:CR=1 FL=1
MGCLKLDISKNYEPLLRVVGKISTTKKMDVNYYPFGSLMPGRNYSSADYRYGFGGHEKDDEIKSSGNSYDFGARMYDPRIGKWFSTDPFEKSYVPISPYAFALNNPIKLIDEDGNVVTDENGNPVTISAPVEQEDGTYASTFIFTEGTSMDVADNFTNNGGRVINALIQVESGREIVAKADQSADNIHIVISPDARIEEKKSAGKTTRSVIFGSTKYGTLTNDKERTATRAFIVTIYEGTVDEVSNSGPHNLSKAKKLYEIDNLTQDQKVASTGAHELDHATDPEQVPTVRQNKKVTESQHEKTRKFQGKVSGEFGEKNSKKK